MRVLALKCCVVARLKFSFGGRNGAIRFEGSERAKQDCTNKSERGTKCQQFKPQCEIHKRAPGLLND